MPRTLISTIPHARREWPDSDVAVLRAHLKRGATLLDIAKSMERHPGDVEQKTAELAPPSQRR